MHTDLSDVLLDRVDIERILAQLTPKERDTIWLWLHDGYTLPEVAEIIKDQYPEESPNLSGRSIGFRIKTILKKVRKIAENPGAYRKTTSKKDLTIARKKKQAKKIIKNRTKV